MAEEGSRTVRSNAIHMLGTRRMKKAPRGAPYPPILPPQFSSSIVPASISVQPTNITSGQRLRGVA
jgi:hypothetical protein